MSDYTQMIGNVLMLLGALVFLVGSYGLLRLPDFYSRLSGVTIAAALGTALLLLGLLLHYPTVLNTVKVGLALLIQLSTAAVGGNALARAGYLTGAPQTPATRFDDLANTEGVPVAPDRQRKPHPKSKKRKKTRRSGR